MNENPIVVKYNNDLEFRRRVAFNRMYHAGNIKRRVAIELLLGLACLAGAIFMWYNGSGAKYYNYAMFCLVLIAAVFYARILRAVLARRRIKPNDPSRADREFVFGEDGFMFGPVNESGEMLKTRWGDFDRVYVTNDIIYLLCMSRKHWAAIDKKLFVSGTWEDLIALIRTKIPKAKIYGISIFLKK